MRRFQRPHIKRRKQRQRITPKTKDKDPKTRETKDTYSQDPFYYHGKDAQVKQCYINISKAQIQESLCNVIVILQRKNVVYNRNIRGT